MKHMLHTRAFNWFTLEFTKELLIPRKLRVMQEFQRNTYVNELIYESMHGNLSDNAISCPRWDNYFQT